MIQSNVETCEVDKLTIDVQSSLNHIIVPQRYADVRVCMYVPTYVYMYTMCARFAIEHLGQYSATSRYLLGGAFCAGLYDFNVITTENIGPMFNRLAKLCTVIIMLQKSSVAGTRTHVNQPTDDLRMHKT